MFNLITRFHLLELTVLVAMTAVAVLRVPADFIYPAHWGRGQPDWLWPRNWALAGGPVLAVLITLGFGILGAVLSRNRVLQSRHLLDPALTLILGIILVVQMGLLLQGVGSDLDLIRIAGFGLGAILIALGVGLYDAQRNSYAGLRMPWPVRSNHAWPIVHRGAGVAFGIAGLALIAAAWLDVGIAVSTLAFALALVIPTLIAAGLTLATRG